MRRLASGPVEVLLILAAALLCLRGQPPPAAPATDCARPAWTLRNIDGDTVVLRIDLGYGVLIDQVCRIRGVDAPEVTGPERDRGLAARDWITKLLPSGEPIVVDDHGRDKYGRRVADLWHKGSNVANLLVEAGHARRSEP